MNRWPTVGSSAGLHVGPISVDVDAPAGAVYAMMTAFGDAERPDLPADPVHGPDDELIREFSTQVRLPFGLRRIIRTREAIRLVPPDAIEFRHLAGPVRGLRERIAVMSIGRGRSRVTYLGVLPRVGPLLGLAHRLLARPAMERVVRAHLAELAERAEKETQRLTPGEAATRST